MLIQSQMHGFDFYLRFNLLLILHASCFFRNAKITETKIRDSRNRMLTGSSFFRIKETQIHGQTGIIKFWNFDPDSVRSQIFARRDWVESVLIRPLFLTLFMIVPGFIERPNRVRTVPTIDGIMTASSDGSNRCEKLRKSKWLNDRLNNGWLIPWTSFLLIHLYPVMLWQARFTKV